MSGRYNEWVNDDDVIKEEEEEEETEEAKAMIPSATSLCRLHSVAGALHLIQAVVAYMVLMNVGRTDAEKERRLSTSRFRLTMRSFDRTQTNVLSATHIKWLIVAFPLLSTVNHAVAAYRLRNGTGDDDAESFADSMSNPFRWAEYAASASAMIWVIAQLSGVTEIPMLTVLTIINVGMQYCGWLVESQPASQRRHYTSLAWLLFIALWVPMVWSFWEATTIDLRRENNNDSTTENGTENRRIPTLVYFVVLFQMSLFVCFGIVNFLFSRPSVVSGEGGDGDDDDGAEAADRRQRQSRRRREVWYIVLSMIAKSMLTWTVIGGALNAGRLNQ